MKILLIEDDPVLTDVLVSTLRVQRYIVDAVADGRRGWDYAQDTSYDLILMDVGLPQQDGITLCRRLRAQGSQVPILLITAQDAKVDRIAGLDAGADDYLTKPLDLAELQARVRALLRRGSETKTPILQVGNLQLDPRSCQVTYAERSLNLTPKEYNLLELFLRHPGQVFSRGQLVEHLWTFDDPPLEESVKAHVKGLRQKLKAAGAVDWIENIYGIGYRLNPPDSEQKSSDSAMSTESPVGPVVSQPLSLEQSFQQARAGLWQKHQGLILERLTLLRQAVNALQQGNLQPKLRQNAAQAAHKLAGILGMFDLDRGTTLARTAEDILEPPAPLTPVRQRQLAEVVDELEDLLKLNLAGASTKQLAAHKVKPVKQGSSLPTVNVLLVDDDPIFLEQIVLLLQPWGIHLTGINNPLELWSVLPSTRPDLLILDVEMPQTSGIELCQSLRSDPEWQSLPIIFLTAHRDRETIQQVFTVGADDFVTKPVVVPELLTRIINRLERTRLIQSLASKDPLTGLFNQLQSSRLLEEQLQPDRVFSLVVFSLPELQHVNLHYGHRIGHQVLQRWGNLLHSHFSNHEILSYWGNGEFVIGLPDCHQGTARDRLDELLIKLRQQVYTSLEGERFQVHFHWAIAEYPLNGQTLRDLYRSTWSGQQ
uniref:Multi-component transcriptional regulator, winged helix family n=1 Tax=Cyanothece sp. (strain PCC 7425 / ATCC 29141) TaxID=395961 RepID=B8HL49_CYAP4